MSLFITRDYGTPRIMMHTASIARKNLTKKVFGTTTIDGVKVLNRRVNFYSTSREYNPEFFPPIGDKRYPAFRSDKLIKRWYKSMGISLKDMRAEEYSKVNDMYWTFNPTKWVASYEDPTTMPDNSVTTLNAYINNSMLSVTSNGTHDYYYANEQYPNNIVASLPYDPLIDEVYAFVVAGEASTTTEDGYFSIDKAGNIRVTLLGVENGMVDYSYTKTNTRTYSIKKVLKDKSSSSSYVNLHVRREFIDIRIIIGGEYVTKPGAVDDWITQNGSDTSISPILNLEGVRTRVEKDPLGMLANLGAVKVEEGDSEAGVPSSKSLLSTAQTFNMGSAYLYTPSAGVSYAGDYTGGEGEGHIFDVLAVLDDGSVFEMITPVFNETLTLVDKVSKWLPTGEYDSSTGDAITYKADMYNLEYSYTKRYRVKNLVTTNSTLHTNILDGLNRIHIGLTSVDFFGRPTGVLKASTVNTIITNSNIDSTLMEALYKVNSWDNLELTDNYFHKGYLKVSVFDSMSSYEFDRFMAKCFDQEISMKKTKWYNKVLGVVIAMVGLVLVVVGAILVLLGQPWGFALMAAGMALLVYGGRWYAKEIGWGPGVMLIAGAAQVSAVVVAVTVIIYSYGQIGEASAALETLTGMIEAGAVVGEAGAIAMNLLVIDLVIASVGLVTSIASLGTALGVVDGDSEAMSILTLTTAIVTLGAQSYTAYANGISFNGLSDLKLSDISGYMKNLNTGVQGYAAYNQLMQNSSKQPASEDHNVIESDGVNAVYAVQERIFENDALENMEIYKDHAFGVNNTMLIVAGQML